MRTKFWLASLRVRDYSADQGVDMRVILKWILEKWGCRVWIEFMWLRIGTGDGLLCTR
jgi:hypothetical protein